MRFRVLILLTLLLLVAAFLTAVVIVSDRVHEREAKRGLADEIEHGATLFADLAKQRRATLANSLHVIAEETRLKDVVDADPLQHAGVHELASKLAATMDSELFMLLDPRGALILDVAERKAGGSPLVDVPVVANTLARGAADGVWVDGDLAFEVAGRRIDLDMGRGHQVVGTVIAGRPIDTAMVEGIARPSGAVVIVLLEGKPIAFAGAERTTIAGLAAGLVDVTADGATTELAVGATRWMARLQPLPGYRGDRRLEYAVVASLDDALVVARALSTRYAQLAGVAWAAAVGLALLLAGVLSRPLDRLVAFTHQIALGDLDARAEELGPTEVRTLAIAMNAMVSELVTAHAQLQKVNAHLERIVDERTRHLALANLEIAEMLDLLQDAVMVVGKDLVVEPRCSRGCARLFAVEHPGGMDVRELLFTRGRMSVDAEALATHSFVLEHAYEADEMQWRLNEHLLLREVEFRHPVEPHRRTYSLRYVPMYEDTGVVGRIMIVVSDITELLALRRGVETEQRRSALRVEALLAFSRCSRLDALHFVDENAARMQRVMQGLRRWAETRRRGELVDVLRELHTLKGSARALKLKQISTRAHALESAAQNMLLPGADAAAGAATDLFALLHELQPALLELEEQLSMHAAVADELLRRESVHPRVDVERMRCWIGALIDERGLPGEGRGPAMLALLRAEAAEEVVGVAKLLEQQRAMIDEVSQQLGKQVRLELKPGNEIYVSPAVAGRIRDAFVHAIRNAVEHGIELPEERVLLGKPRTGTITMTWLRRRDHWLVRLSDDGRGVDEEKIVALARAKGIIAADERPLGRGVNELLFIPGFSSKPVADGFHGLGAGLGAMRKALRECGLTIGLSSTKGRGTTLELRMPLPAVCFEEEGGAPVDEGARDRMLAAA